MDSKRIAFIGGGNMAASLIGGLIAGGWDPDRIRVADPDPARRENVRSRFPVHTGADNTAAVDGADVVIVAVKPQTVPQVARELAAELHQQQPLVISIAAGVRVPDIQRWLAGDLPVVRAMPNTPALVQSGATALYASASVREDQRELAETLLRAVGATLWVEDEPLLDAVTALSGSGPAYFFLVMEALEQAGTDLGLDPGQARLLSVETALGAARMALESDAGPAQLRRRVTSPGGTTEQALGVLEDGELRRLFAEALTAARDRARELADEMGRQ